MNKIRMFQHLTTQRPVIVMGMHRSGTSLLTRILEDFGIFMGNNQDGNSESHFFQYLNRWMFQQAGARWDFPIHIEGLLSDELFTNLVTDYLRKCVYGPKLIRYFGIKKSFAVLRQKQTFSWGWKDPRNVYTIPFWLTIFPEAKIIYIERHGVDVASSLVKRCKKYEQLSIGNLKEDKWSYISYSRQKGLMHSFRCNNLDGAFTLWENYVIEARKNLQNMNSTEVFRIKFEDLVTNSDSTLTNISEFIGHEVTEKVRRHLKSIENVKAYAYKNNRELKVFAEMVSDRMENI